MSEPICTIRLTRSQQMALLSVIAEQLKNNHATQQFINFSTSPPTSTNVSDLMLLIINATFKEGSQQ